MCLCFTFWPRCIKCCCALYVTLGASEMCLLVQAETLKELGCGTLSCLNNTACLSRREATALVSESLVGSSDKAAGSEKESTSQRKKELRKYIQKWKPASVGTLTSS